ncbi:bifunctional aspartate transaminase/aspartate 4-decarboxylase [Lyngbya confervoides]|uniref:Bifunctional aspartate transaminase/aspartate 4-decarboxylase n=1 Tax=Lyngbya confervoides BDU141951 TaxID=1574623 RepID=A0ABD4T1J1_9CYAN|nr:bifunctional aspartate transaminase/aspartate 4-decarboxylase [Lyngbya confervoides]MCM1982577.1 bifunctional aspartate transaminase/aspartate 4-decarboxylase [Lyngbya confervoides BDU141951]
MKKADRRKYATLSPFQLKDQLIQFATSHAERMMLNAGRGNPNWLATTPRAGFFQLGLFAVEESQRVLTKDQLGGIPHREGIALRLEQFLAARSQQPGIAFLHDCLTYGATHLNLDPDEWVYELVQGILGDCYPEPVRVLSQTEKVLQRYLVQELCNDQPPPGQYDLFATEGGTAAICYIFNSLLENKILHKHDKIALGTPIFTPYLEIPHLNTFRLQSLAVEASEAMGWQIPATELDKLADQEVKAFFLCNPANPTSVRLESNAIAKLVDLVTTERPDLIVITDDVYSTFVEDFRSLMAVLPQNTITVYSYSKYFGATGWRLGVIALHRDNVIDRMIAALPASTTRHLNQRYAHLHLEPQRLKFIDRMVADSRNVALNHTAGLSTPQQVQMVLFSLFCLLDHEDHYQHTCQGLVTQRWQALYQALGSVSPHAPDHTHYYTTIDLLKLAMDSYDSDFVDYLVKHHHPLDFVFQLAQDQGIVLLPGGGFEAPQWSVRVSLANLPDAAYVRIGQAIIALMQAYHAEWKAKTDTHTPPPRVPSSMRHRVRPGSHSFAAFDPDRDRFEYRCECGTRQPAHLHPIPGILLIGGAEEGCLGEDAATRWFLNRARGGDYLVLRLGGVGSQAAWVCDHYREFVNSAAELSIDSRAAANHPAVIQLIRDADALFIAGGNQNEYEDYWEGSAVETAINDLIHRKKIPIAGTSAGMAILGDYYYAPAHEGVISSEILNDPFHHNTKDLYRSDFIQVPFLKHVITDTHLDRRDRDYPETRYGRLFGFLARIVHDTGNQHPVYGIGLEEGSFVAIDEHGIATVFGNGTTQGQDAYFLQTQGLAPEQIQPGLPLIWNHHGKAVKVYRISGTPEGSGQFNLTNWSQAEGGRWEYWFTRGGSAGFHPIL